MNRSAASFCVSCGRLLSLSRPSDPAPLPPGQIREAIAAAPQRTLREGPALSSGRHPFLWRDCPLGVLVFASRSDHDATRVALLDGQDVGRGRVLADDWPAPALWLTEPLVSEHGVFVATETAVHGLAFHGYDSVGAKVVWRPETGSIAAVMMASARTVLALVAEQNGTLAAWSGNGQAAEWRHLWTAGLRKDTAEPVLAGPLASSQDDGGPGALWLLAGGRLHVVASDTGKVTLTLDAKQATPHSPLIYRRLAAGQFDPFAYGRRWSDTRLVLPVTDGSGGIGVLALKPGAAMRRIGDFSPTGWAVAHPCGDALLVGEGSWLRVFVDDDRSSEHELKAVRFSLPPLVSGRRLMAVAERQSRPGGTPEVELVVLELPVIGPAAAGDARIILREPLSGVPVAGLAPLMSGPALLLALERGRGEIVVHSVRVSE